MNVDMNEGTNVDTFRFQAQNYKFWTAPGFRLKTYYKCIYFEN